MDAHLTLYRGESLVREYPLDKPCVTIGRHADNDIFVEDESISRHHAQVLQRETGQSLLKDLDSRNWSWVNGTRVLPESPWVLADGDIITLGMAKQRLVFSDEASTRRLPVKGRGIVIVETTREVYVRGQLVHPPLTRNQYLLLTLLAHKPGQVCAREEIVETVWPEARGEVSDEMIDALVKRLRQRLAEYGSEFIVTVPRHGFRLVES